MKTKILIIDDEQGLRDMMSFELSHEGYEIITANNGKEGLLKIKEQKIDLVISDIKMPEMDGITVLGEIKKYDPEIEVIMATGYASLETAILSLKLGAYDFINKPFSIDEIQNVAKNAVNSIQLKKQLKQLNKDLLKANNELLTINDSLDRKVEERTKKLFESEERYRVVINTMSEGLLKVDNNDVIQFVNDRMAQLTGYSSEELMGKVANEIFVDEENRNVIRQKNVLRKEKMADIYEVQIIKKTGEKLWLSISGSPVLDNEGNVIGSIGVHSDITERKKAEEEIEKNRTHLKAILQSTADGILAVGANNEVLYFNQRFQKLWNIPEKVIKTKNDKILLDFVLEQLSNPKEYIDKVAELYRSDKESFDAVDFKDGRIFERYSCPLIQGDIQGRVWSFRDVTVVKQNEKLVRESEERYRMLVNTMNEGLLTVDNNDVIQFANEKMVQLTGYSHEELIGKTMGELVVSEEFGDLMKQKNALRKEKISDSYEIQYLKKNGEKAWMLISGSAIIDDQGNVIGSIGVHSDITERKKVEEKLIQLSQAVEQSPVSIVITDTDGNIEYTNPIFTLATGYFFEEVKGKNPRFLKSGQTSASEYKKMWDTISSGKKWRGEFHNKKKNGELFWESALLSPILNSEGVIINYLAVKADITQRKQDEENLKSSEQKFRSVAQSATDAIVSANQNGEIMGWNDGAQKIFGYTESEIMGQPLEKIIPQNYRDRHQKGFDHYHQTGEANLFGKTVEINGLNKNKNVFPIELSLAKWETNEGRFFTAIIRDITDRKQAEALNEKITADIIQRNEDLEQFTYMVSHNLRAPVANILGLTSLVLDENPDVAVEKELIEGLSASAKKLDNVIMDMNTILTIRNVGNHLKGMVIFSQLITDIQSTLKNLIEKEKASILFNFSEVDEMLTIKSYLQSIFYNLISNSIKYHQPNIPPLIEITSHKLNNNIVLLFKDNGMGIDLNKYGDKVFGFYRRFHPNIAEGNGVGLYMVKTQVESIGGKISIESEVNKGTIFKIEFEN